MVDREQICVVCSLTVFKWVVAWHPEGVVQDVL